MSSAAGLLSVVAAACDTRAVQQCSGHSHRSLITQVMARGGEGWASIHVCGSQGLWLLQWHAPTGTYVPTVSVDAHAYHVVVWRVWMHSKIRASLASACQGPSLPSYA